MKKIFLTKLGLFFFIGLMILTGINYLYENTNGYKGMNDVYKFQNVPYDIEILNMGSSHGRNSFWYEDCELQGFNFALASQGFYYDYRILSQYRNRLKEGTIVLIPISYFSFYQDYSGDEFERRNPRYYSFLEKDFIYEFNYVDYLKYNKYPILSAGLTIRFLIRDKENYKNEWEYAKENRYLQNELSTIGYEKSILHKEIITKSNGSTSKALKELQNLIDLCKSEKAVPVLVTTPFLNEYNKQFSKEFYDEFYSIVDTIKTKNDLLYIDYSHDDQFSSKYKLFTDTDHLNLNGRKEFTQRILQDLRAMNKL